MISINKTVLLGYVGAEPEVRFNSTTNSKLIVISVATKQTYKDKSSEKYIDKTEWHDVSIFKPNLISLIEGRLKKGDYIYVEGSLSKVSWNDKMGNEKVAVQIQIREPNHDLKFWRQKSESKESLEENNKKTPAKKVIKKKVK